MNVLVSACLLGIHCRYDGMDNFIEEMNLLKDKYHLIPVCPEIYGGLSTPREPAEQREKKVFTRSGTDVTSAFEKGADEILKLVKFYNCKYAILKERSPSCGFGQIYDGTFSKTLIPGNGILADLLYKNGIQIIGESKLEEFISQKTG